MFSDGKYGRQLVATVIFFFKALLFFSDWGVHCPPLTLAGSATGYKILHKPHDRPRPLNYPSLFYFILINLINILIGFIDRFKSRYALNLLRDNLWRNATSVQQRYYPIII